MAKDIGKSEALIRQLCSLGLESRIVVPRLLRLLHDFIPSFANVYFWLAEDGSIVDIYDEYPESYAALPLYLSEYCNTKELEVWNGLAGAAQFRTAIDMEQLWKVDKRQLLRHDFYEDFLKQVGHFHGLHRSIFVDGKPRGLLQIKRNVGDSPFENEDIQKLDRIAQHIEFAIKHQGREIGQSRGGAIETVSLIVDARGKIHHYTDKAERMMMLSQSERQMSRHKQFSYTSLPPALHKLVTRVKKIGRGANRQPATKTVSNRWGSFTFSAIPLNPHNNIGSKELYLLQIEQHIPLKVRLLDELDSYSLSTRQLEICLHIAAGESYAKIAELMDVMPSTVVTHRKALFSKLGISNRHEISTTILSRKLF